MLTPFHERIMLEGEIDGGASAPAPVGVAEPPSIAQSSPEIGQDAATPSQAEPSSPPSEAAGGEEPEGEGTTPAQLWDAMRESGFTAEHIDKIISGMDPADRSSMRSYQAAEQRGEARALTQKGEEDKAIADRESAWADTIARGDTLEQGLDRAAYERASLRPDADMATVKGITDAIVAGKLAQAARDHASLPDRLRERYAEQIGQLNEDEQTRMAEARRKDVRAGSSEEQLSTLMDIAFERVSARAEQRGERNAVRKNGAAAETIKQGAQLMEAIRTAAPRITGQAAATSARAQLQAEIQALDPYAPGAEEKLEELHRRERALPR